MGESRHIGIVTVTYNSGSVLDPFFDSVMAQVHAPWTLYVIDNDSQDDTLERVKARYDPRVVLVSNKKNLGVAEGNNQGIRLALKDGCDFVLLLNNDTEFGPTLLSDLLDGLEAHQADMVVPKMFFFDDPEKIWCVGGEFYTWRGFSSHHFGEGEHDHGQWDTPRRITYCPTCCMLIRKEVFEQVGMMDPKYFVYWDDSDFCYRAIQSGQHMWTVPTAKLWHKIGSLTGGSFSTFTLFYGTRNKIYFLFKNRPFVSAVMHTVAYWVYLIISPGLQGMTWSQFKVRQSGFFAGLRMARGRE